MVYFKEIITVIRKMLQGAVSCHAISNLNIWPYGWCNCQKAAWWSWKRVAQPIIGDAYDPRMLGISTLWTMHLEPSKAFFADAEILVMDKNIQILKFILAGKSLWKGWVFPLHSAVGNTNFGTIILYACHFAGSKDFVT